MSASGQEIQAAEVVLRCGAVEETAAFFCDRLGFMREMVLPADAPAVVVVSGYGLRLRLERGEGGHGGEVRLRCADPDRVADGQRELRAPNGTRVLLVEADAAVVVPPFQPGLVVSRGDRSDAWGAGRAGMAYRDLIPGRLGGRYVASHIRVGSEGPVADQPHYHRVRFQVIYCLRGEATLVYEDHGEPFVMGAGDCVLQPPLIRHQVLETRGGLEVVEVSCPADHETRMDHGVQLPTRAGQEERRHLEHGFLRHVSADAPVASMGGCSVRDTGIAAATGGLVDVRVMRPAAQVPSPSVPAAGELRFCFVTRGRCVLRGGGRELPLKAADACTLPPSTEYVVDAASGDVELLWVSGSPDRR